MQPRYEDVFWIYTVTHSVFVSSMHRGWHVDKTISADSFVLILSAILNMQCNTHLIFSDTLERSHQNLCYITKVGILQAREHHHHIMLQALSDHRAYSYQSGIHFKLFSALKCMWGDALLSILNLPTMVRR